ncbi:MAG: hypothetical protein II075_09745 [Bacteroidales bacterium]|nr:hypothetical protein [Bacteroidales bacterium]
MNNRKKTAAHDALQAAKKASREEEIMLHGKLISTMPTKIRQSKKVYDRKRDRKNLDRYDDYGRDFLFIGVSLAA